MICALMTELLDLYLDKRLVGFQARWVETHLSRCPACAARAAQLRQLKLGLRAFYVPAVPAQLKRRLAAALKAEVQTAPEAAPWAEWELPEVQAPALSFAFSALAFILFVSGSVFGPGLESQAYSEPVTRIQK